MAHASRVCGALGVGIAFLAATLVLLDHAVNPAGRVVARGSEERRRLTAGTEEQAVVGIGGVNLGVQLEGGFCSKVKGPLLQDKPTSTGQLWSANVDHILCYQPWLTHPEFKLMVVSADKPAGKKGDGEYGFGQGVKVQLQSDISSDVKWTLAEGVTTLPMEMHDNSWFRALALDVSGSAPAEEMPVVVWTPMLQDWPVLVQFANASSGVCRAARSWGRRQFLCIPSQTRQEVQLLAFGQPQSPYALDPDLVDHEWRVTVSGKDLGTTGGAEAWASWTTLSPAAGKAVQFEVKASKVSEVGRRLGDTEEVEIIDVIVFDGDLNVLSSINERPLHLAGHALAFLGVCGLLLAACSVGGALVFGFPSRFRAVMPAASATLLIFQLVAHINDDPSAPMPLRAVCGPIANIGGVHANAGVSFGYCLGALLITAVAHGVAILSHIVHNGKGSAALLPWGLKKFGSWELRTLSLIAFPLAASSVGLITKWMFEFDFPTSDFVFNSISAKILATMVIIVMCTLVNAAWSTVSTAISEGFVVRLSMTVLSADGPVTSTIFADRVADRLLAMPEPVPNGKLHRWLANPAWSANPPAATIERVEYTVLTSGRPTTWSEWAPETPAGKWRKQRNVLATRQASATNRHALARGHSTDGNSNGNGYGNGHGNGHAGNGHHSNNPQVHEEADGMFDGGGDVADAHPIPTIVQRAYKGRTIKHTYSGVVCLPWLDVALSTEAVAKLAPGLDRLACRAGVGQVSGPYTHGRFAACYDWGTNWPWRWPMDIAFKIVFGCWAGLTPHFEQYDMEELHRTYPAVLSLVVMACSIAATLVAYRVQPYSHVVDNWSYVMSLLAASLCIGLCHAEKAIALLAPARWVSWIGAIALIFVMAIPMLATCIVGFAGCLSCAASKHGPSNVLVGWSDDTGGGDDHDHMATIKLQDFHHERALELPVKLVPKVRYAKLRAGLQRRRPELVETDVADAWLSMPSHYLFPAGGFVEGDVARYTPAAAIVEQPNDGQLFYAEDELNSGGVPWGDAVRRYLGSRPEEHARKVQNFIEAVGRGGDEETLAVIEVDPSSSR